MGLSDLKFTEADFLNKKIADLSDTPNSDGMSAADLKAYFDYIPKTLIALTRLNSVIDIINSASGAGEVGASTISGVTGTTAQALLEGLKSLIDLRYTKDETDNLLSFKATNETVSQLVKNVDFDENTGKFTFTFESGNTKVIDTAMEKITVNFSYDSDTQSLVLIHVDGTTESISLAEFITNNEFEDSDTIAITVTDGIVKAEIQPGSITDDMLSSALLTALVNYVSSAADSAGAAASSETNAGTYAQTASAAAGTATQKAADALNSAENAENANKSAQSFAKGGTGTRDGEDTDNAKYYAEQASASADSANSSAQAATVSATNASNAASSAEASAQAAEQAKNQAQEIVGGDFLNKSGDGSDLTAAFTEATERNNISTGEKMSILFGKIKKCFSDLKSVAFSGDYADLINTPVPETFIATYGTTTNAEIEAAYQAGKVVYCKVDGAAQYFIPLIGRGGEDYHVFTWADLNTLTRQNGIITCINNKWSIRYITIPAIKVITATLTIDGWEADGDGFKQIVAVSNIPTSGYVYTAYPDSSQYKVWTEAGIYADDVATANSITFHCTTKPTVAVVVNIKKEQVT